MAEVTAGPKVAADEDPATHAVPIGGYVCVDARIELHGKLAATRLKVRNTGDRPVQVGSHFHFFEANRALDFDRAAAFGCHLAIPSATALRFEPGDEREVTLVPFRGARGVYGFNNLVDGPTAGKTAAEAKARAVARARRRGFRMGDAR
jgi:urease subunit beta